MSMEHSQTDLIDAFEMVGIPRGLVYLQDVKYVTLDDDKVDSFYFSLHLQAIGIFKGWSQEVTDCDKFSRLVQVVGLIAHSKRYKGKPAGLAIAVYDYTTDAGEGHSINLIVTSGKTGELFVNFYEPQTGKRVFPSLKEKQNSRLVYL